ncbi:cytochrome P450 72A225-like [Salvia miltiorrhiza]|uniref:cytochrome P450 72A225-like n=1 Tax=Salvia miltiorrhiza TaxID=226208 RepID=UPI0025AD314D|nr:cytochrome P450 72A225-like [Salvia miltiorrhiza]
MKLSSVLCSILVGGVIALASAWAVKLVNWVWLRPRKLEKLLRQQGLQGNSYRLLLGDIKDLISVAKQHQLKAIQLSDSIPPHIFPYFHQSITKYGENCFIWFGATPRLMISDPELMKEILARPDVFRKPQPDPIGQTVAGGLLFLEGHKWAKHRRIINPAFHTHKLQNMVPAITLSCSNMIAKWEALVSGNGGEEIDVWPFIQDFSGDVISKAAFGSSHEQGRRIFELQKELLNLVLDLMHFMFIPGWRYVPTRANRRSKEMSEEMRSVLKGMIKQREEAGSDGDLLGTLMDSNRGEADGMSMEDVIEECKLFYLAGSETTSLLLVWTMVMLSKHQEWQDRAREEVLQVFGERDPSYDALNRLKIVTMILKEVLRMYPPAPLIARAATETVQLGGMSVPVGVDLLLLIGAMHHDPKIWGDDVSEFKPERFESGQSSLLAFGGGPRVCIGQNLGMIEAKIALAMMLQRFSFHLSPSYLHAPFFIITLQPQHGAPLLLRHLP